MNKELKDDEQALLDKVLASRISIPPQPAIVQEIEKLVSGSNNPLSAISKLIEKDAGLSAAIFRLVNSPFYKSPARITSIQQAITILGMTQVTNLVKGLSLRKAVGGRELAYEKFWERSEEMARLCGIVAGQQMLTCNVAVDQAYMAGLFHECGVPILMQHIPQYCETFRLNQGEGWPDFCEEDRRFRLDYAVVGFLVCRHWRLPELVCQAVRFHRDRLSVDHAALTLVSILQMARHLHRQIYRLPDEEWPGIRESVLQEIGVSAEGAAEFMEETLEIFSARQ